jgi:hypothetical protein
VLCGTKIAKLPHKLGDLGILGVERTASQEEKQNSTSLRGSGSHSFYWRIAQ